MKLSRENLKFASHVPLKSLYFIRYMDDVYKNIRFLTFLHIVHVRAVCFRVERVAEFGDFSKNT